MYVLEIHVNRKKNTPRSNVEFENTKMAWQKSERSESHFLDFTRFIYFALLSNKLFPSSQTFLSRIENFLFLSKMSSITTKN